METVPVIVGTAGHIDHGKTSLVRALTGIDTDRLPEEKARGITIELGFAHLDIGGRRFGVVDVPGHERFLKTMVAGAAGVDVALFVVAADEGVMPQTREHLDVCELLGIRAGVVALTKADLVEPAWLDLVSADVRDALAGTFLENAPIVPVSALTGQGMHALRDLLAGAAARVSPRRDDGAFRLPLDRVFTVKGHGTVVTGTIHGGRVAVGDELVSVPTGRAMKVRGLEVHGQAIDVARAGMRCAINVAGVERDDLARGDTLVHEGRVVASQILDVRVRHGRHAAGPLPARARLLVHHGTAQVIGQLILVARDQLEPGEEGLAQLRLERPVAALPGDRFLLRGFALQRHYGTTLGGGDVLRTVAPKLRRSSADAAERVAAFASAAPDERLALEIRAQGPRGATADELCARLGWSAETVDATLRRLAEGREVAVVERHAVHAAVLAELEAAALAAVSRFQEEHPQRPGIPREELRTRLPAGLPPRVFDAMLVDLEARAALAVDADGASVRRARAAAPLDRLAAAAAAACAGLETPRPKELAASLGRPEKEVKDALAAAARAGVLARIRDDYYVDAAALADLRARLAAHLDAHGQITPPEWKDLCGLSRKFTIPLAEHFDAEKLTLRIGDLRRRRS